MALFWIAAALLAALAVGVVLHRAARTPAASDRPELQVYGRQLAELEELRGRGVLDDAGYAAAEAEAARRLLKAGDDAGAPERASPRDRRVVLGAAVAVAALALAVYLLVGAPGRPDEPYAARVAAWRAQDPATLDAPRLTAVLEDVARERPDDPQVWLFLGRVRSAAEDELGAERAFRRAAELAPSNPDVWAALGEARTALNDGRVGPDARAAFQRALRLQPGQPSARYFLGKAALDEGRTEDGLGAWRALAAELPFGDPRRAALEAEIAQAAGGDADPAVEGVAAATPVEQQAMIRGMVEGLASRLETAPYDPAGWARLVRAYTVLGDTAARDQALARARRLFEDRPADLAAIESAARPDRPPP
jgi:cytochrome c-type biogenesis protein CcmH